jgi:hypothetical protein
MQFNSVIDRYTAIMNLTCRTYPRLPKEVANIIAEFGLVSLECGYCKESIRYTNERNICWVQRKNDSILCNKCDNKTFNLQEAYKNFQS